MALQSRAKRVGEDLIFVLAVVNACTREPASQSAATINRPFVVSGLRVEPDSLNAYLAAHHGFASRGGQMRCAYRPLGQLGTRVFVWAVCAELLAVEDHLVDGSGMSLPVAFEIGVDGGGARVVGAEVPQNGNGYSSSIRRIFPANTWPAIFSNGTGDQPAGGLESQLRKEAAARFGLPPAAASAPRTRDPRPTQRESFNAALDSAARQVVAFLQGKVPFQQIALGDSVTLYVAPEGGNGRTTLGREQLIHPTAWKVRSGGRVVLLSPQARMTKVTTKVGRHFNCREQSLAAKFPRLARLPHVGTKLEPENSRSCLETWNLTLLFDTTAGPRVVGAVYDQWEW